jgi:hypothetical protein
MYQLSTVVDDDLYKLAFIIQSFDDSNPTFNHILWDLRALKVNKYSESIDIALSNTPSRLKEISRGMTFKTLKGYNEYLMSLLRLHNIEFSPYIQHIQTRSPSYNSVTCVYETLDEPISK